MMSTSINNSEIRLTKSYNDHNHVFKTKIKIKSGPKNESKRVLRSNIRNWDCLSTSKTCNPMAIIEALTICHKEDQVCLGESP